MHTEIIIKKLGHEDNDFGIFNQEGLLHRFKVTYSDLDHTYICLSNGVVVCIFYNQSVAQFMLCTVYKGNCHHPQVYSGEARIHGPIYWVSVSKDLVCHDQENKHA